jgi:outer membrane protein OmpA-like peptidoglycan-associated protein/opacity protein-like surface antigen
MKKITITLLCVMVLCGGISAQQFAYDKSYAKWSIALKAGIDYYRVDPYATEEATRHGGVYSLQASWAVPAFNVEYTINPYFGIGFEAGWMHYNRGVRNDPNGFASGVYYGNTIDGIIYGSVNITNVVAPYRKGNWRKLSLYGNLGIGAGCYDYKRPQDEKRSFHGSPVGMGSLTLAYNLNKGWELFLEGQYRAYTKEDMGGETLQGNKSTDAIVAFFGVRYKFKETKSLNGHARSLYAPDYEANMAEKDSGTKKLLNELTDEVNALKGKTDQLGKDVDDLKNNAAETKDDIQEVKDRVKALEDEIKQLKKGDSASATFDKIEFETGSTKLTAESRAILENLVEMFKANSWTRLEVKGHTDNIADAAYNQKLSEERATAVKAYLVKAGFDASKISTTGYSYNQPIATNDTADGRQKNRRVEITVVK